MPYTTLVSGTVIASAWGNASVRDQVVSPFATTAARDSAITVPVVGMIAYISSNDANEGVVTRTSGSVWRAPWNIGWGLVSNATTTLSTTTSGTTATNFMSGQAFTAVGNRNYIGTYSSIFTMSVGLDIFTVELRDGGVAAAVMGSTQRFTASTATSQDGRTYRTAAFTIAAGSHTPWFICTRVAGTGTLSSLNGAITGVQIEDVGPAGAPA